MMKRVFSLRIAALAVASLSLTACQTVKMPKLSDLVKSPEFSEDAAKISQDFPRVKDAPFEPTDIRSDAQWDKDANAILALRDKPNQISSESGLTAAQAEAEYEKLKAKAQAYKKDDPAAGPVEGFPKYEPRR